MLTLKRVVRAGFFSFWRNSFVSLSAMLVMIVTLFVVGSTIFLSAILTSTLSQLRDKVDINVYFVRTAAEEDILALKAKIETFKEIAPPVVYTSREEALAEFKKRHENDEFTLQSIEELGYNPLGASLNIRAKDPGQYENIAKFLESERKTQIEKGSVLIDKMNYEQNKGAIDRLSSIINTTERMGFIIILVFIGISILITFNTIRLVIYMSKDEISVMRLVGASTLYIQLPFLVTSAIYGFLAGVVTLIMFYPITLWLGNATSNFLGGFNLFEYYTTNFGQIFLIIMFFGVMIGVISSAFAVRKYLRV